MAGSDRGKLIPTDIGIVVNDFLMENFPEILDYNFTAKVEKTSIRLPRAKLKWNKEMKTFYKSFEPQVEKVMNARSEHKAGERELGVDPKSGKPVYVKIGRFGPVVQIGDANDNDKPRFSQLPANKSMETITLDEALELFKLPRTVGQFEGSDVTIGSGRFGPYVLHDKSYVSIPKTIDPMAITLDEAVELIQQKREAEKKRHLKAFDEDPKMEVMNGRYGPYIAYDGRTTASIRLSANVRPNSPTRSVRRLWRMHRNQNQEGNDNTQNYPIRLYGCRQDNRRKGTGKGVEPPVLRPRLVH